jgi:hypothetical protein
MNKNSSASKTFIDNSGAVPFAGIPSTKTPIVTIAPISGTLTDHGVSS